jgi:spore coat polysaccharide biosynthesis predicted glycosyltransferase SpsG/CMP-N-acetylneuraminic acid synthetase
MFLQKTCILIPAIKKNVAFTNDLVKKLNGITLIQRTINKAKKITEKNAIFVVTDSEEISLIAQRNNIEFYYDSTLNINNSNLIKDLHNFFLKELKAFEHLILLWPYVPLLPVEKIFDAYEQLNNIDYNTLTTVTKQHHRPFNEKHENLNFFIFDRFSEKKFYESRAFAIFEMNTIQNSANFKVFPYLLDEETIEIKSPQDWWISEKMLKRKRIVFRVIGSSKVGMGHIHRCLSIANEITSHEIVFITDQEINTAMQKIIHSEYMIIFSESEKLIQDILKLKPDLVVNDSLDTKKKFIQSLRENKVKVISFEDRGEGANFTNITFNQLYENDGSFPNHVKYGHQFLFLRDEFINAKKHRFKKNVSSVLLTFGGSDPTNLTMITLTRIFDFCVNHNIHIHIVVGYGYEFLDQLQKFIDIMEYPKITLITKTGIMSSIMEETGVAISSNGQTVYELAHMNIPTIVISHSEREDFHPFVKENHGFIYLGIYSKKLSEKILPTFKELYENEAVRKKLLREMKNIDFSKNKSRVVNKMLSLIR